MRSKRNYQAINNLLNKLILELEVSTGSFFFEHDVNDISDMCTCFSCRGTSIVDVGNNSTSCFGHADGAFVGDVCRHGFCGCKTGSFTNEAYANVASGYFRNFVLASYTAISYEEGFACFDSVCFKTVHDCGDNDVIVSFDCSAGKAVSCEYNNLRSFFVEASSASANSAIPAYLIYFLLFNVLETMPYLAAARMSVAENRFSAQEHSVFLLRRYTVRSAIPAYYIYFTTVSIITFENRFVKRNLLAVPRHIMPRRSCYYYLSFLAFFSLFFLTRFFLSISGSSNTSSGGLSRSHGLAR